MKTHSKKYLAEAEALFASPLQPADHPGEPQVHEAITASLRRHHGAAGCAAVMVAEFERSPDEAVDRMSWVLSLMPDPDNTRSVPTLTRRDRLPA